MPTNTQLPKSSSSFLVYGIKSMHRAVRGMSPPSTPTPSRTVENKIKPSGSSFMRTVTSVCKTVLPPKPALPKPPISRSLPISRPATKVELRATARSARTASKAPAAPKPEPFARKPLPSFKTPSPPRKPPVPRMNPTSGSRKSCATVVATCSPARAPILRASTHLASAKKSVRWEMDSIDSPLPSPIFDSSPVSPVSTAPSTPEPMLETQNVDVFRVGKMQQVAPELAARVLVKVEKKEVVTKAPHVAMSPKKMPTKSSVNKENVMPMPRVRPASGTAKRELVVAKQAPMSSVTHTALVTDLTRALQNPQSVMVTENTPFGPRRVRRVVVPDYTGTPASADPNIQREIAALRTQARVAAPTGVAHGANEQGISLRALETINRVRRERGMGELKTVPRNIVANRA